MCIIERQREFIIILRCDIEWHHCIMRDLDIPRCIDIS